MSVFVLDFQDIDKTKLSEVGGKGANLGELARIEGIRVPGGTEGHIVFGSGKVWAQR